MRKKSLFIFMIIFLSTGCSANYTIEVFNNEIKEELYIEETDMIKASETDDMDMSFEDYAKEYGLINDYYTSYYNMYQDEDALCTETEDNDCRFYNKEYIKDNEKVGFRLSSTFSFDEYKDATIPSDLMPGFSSNFDGKYLTITGGSNWDFLKGYDNLDELNIYIKSNYYPTSTNIKYNGNGLYTWTVTKANNKELEPFYITFDTTSTKKLASENSKIVGIIMISIIGIILLFFAIKILIGIRNNNRI